MCNESSANWLDSTTLLIPSKKTGGREPASSTPMLCARLPFLEWMERALVAVENALSKFQNLARPFLTWGIHIQMRRKKEGLLAQTREMIGTGIPKRRKKGGVFDRNNEKRVLIPSKRTCWEIHLYLLKMPSSGCYSACQKIFDVTPHHHIITLVTSSHLSIEHCTHPSISTLHHYRAHNSSFWLIDTSLWRASWPSSRSGRGKRRRRRRRKRRREEAMVGVSLMTTTMMATTMWWWWWWWWLMTDDILLLTFCCHLCFSPVLYFP